MVLHLEIGFNTGDVVAGKYRIERPIGQGGSATVYRAQREGTQLAVALKVMHSKHPEHAIERKRFIREAEMVQKLDHPNIVRVIDYGHTEVGVPYIVFALLRGRSLKQRLKAEGPLGVHEVGRFGVHILRALDRAHAMNIVHRDIKPANVFLSRTGEGEVAQVLDFGLAKAIAGEQHLTKLTRAGFVLGTPRYMAPEQVRAEEVGQPADIYAVGLVMAEMLIGRPVIEAEADLDVFLAHGSNAPLPLPTVVTSSPIGGVIQRALAKSLSVRYRLASQMLADLEGVMRQLEQNGGSVSNEAELVATMIVSDDHYMGAPPSSAHTLSPPPSRAAPVSQAVPYAGSPAPPASNGSLGHNCPASYPHPPVSQQIYQAPAQPAAYGPPAAAPSPAPAAPMAQAVAARPDRLRSVAIVALVLVLVAASALVGWVLAGRNEGAIRTGPGEARAAFGRAAASAHV